MARVDPPRSDLRKRRRRRRSARVLAYVLLALAAGGALGWFIRAPFVRIDRIEVTGARAVATSTVEAEVMGQLGGSYAYLFPRNSIFLYPREAIVQLLLERHSVFDRVDVHATDFHTITVSVAEREPVALWCPWAGEESGCSYMDEAGVVYAPAPDVAGSAYVTYQGAVQPAGRPGVRQYLTQKEFQSLTALVAALAVKVPDTPVGAVAVDETGDTRAYFRDDFLLMFNLTDNGGDVFERFSLALQSEPFAGKKLSDFEYLDLRFGDKLYYKSKQ